MEKFDQDPFSVSMDETNMASEDIIAMVYKNVEVCQVQHLTESYNTWCTDNKDLCEGNDDKFMERIMANGMDIISAGYDFITVLMKADDCTTDQETIDMLNHVYGDM